MLSPMDGNDQRLDALFREYRDACPAPEPSVNFMPELWQKIEARNNFTYALRRWTGAFVTAALAFSLAIGVYSMLPHGSSSSFYSQNYVEALAAAHDMDLTEPGDSSQVY